MSGLVCSTRLPAGQARGVTLPEPPAVKSDVVSRGVVDAWASRLLLLAPPPAGDFRHVVAVLADIVLVLDQLVAQRLLEVGGPSAELRQAVDHVHDQVEAVQVV